MTVGEDFSLKKALYVTGILLSLLGFEGPRHHFLNFFNHAGSGAQLEPAKASQPLHRRTSPLDRTVPHYLRPYNGPRDA
jgi:hypothetical protein